MKLYDKEALPFRSNMVGKQGGDGGSSVFTQQLIGVTLDRPAYVMISQVHVWGNIVDSTDRPLTALSWGCTVVLGLGGNLPVSMIPTNLFSQRSVSAGTLDSLNLNEIRFGLSSAMQLDKTMSFPDHTFVVNATASSMIATYQWRVTSAPSASQYMKVQFAMSGWFAFL